MQANVLENFHYVLTASLVIILAPASYAVAADFQTLYKFSGSADGGGPVTAVTVRPSGTLYGTTLNGGVVSAFHDSGVVFELEQPSQRQRFWNERVLYTFSVTNDGYSPESPLGPCQPGRQETGRWANNRAENSHQPFRRREHAMLRFRSMKSLQKFSSVHAAFHNHFNQDRHLISRRDYKVRRAAAQAEWKSLAT